MTRPRIALFMSHLIGNALLLLLGYYWLGLGESDASHLALSAIVILFFALGAIWLHGTSLVLFSQESSLLTSSKRTLRSLLPLVLLAILVLLVYLALGHFYNSFGHQAFNIGSYSTMKLRRPVEPNRVLSVFHGFIWLLRWFIVPALVWPLASEIANRGWKGFNVSAFKKSKEPLFLIPAGVLLLIAVYLPLQLFYWIPAMPNFSMEVISVMCRMGVGYLLFTTALLGIEFLTSSGNPRLTQDSTVVSP